MNRFSIHSIDLNADVGEQIADTTENYDAELMPLLTSCHIACGFHSGNPLLMQRTIDLALQYGVRIGAHPSYHDPEHFGRRHLDVPTDQLMAELRYQIGALKAMVEAKNARLSHVKPHGALYNDIARDVRLAELFASVIHQIDTQLVVFLQAESRGAKIIEESGLRVVAEGFADRQYAAVDRLRSRQFPDAVLTQPNAVLQHVRTLLGHEVTLYDGRREPLRIQSLCLHGDTPGAVQLARGIHQFLLDHDIPIAAYC